jgi:hypothetical protein
MDFNLVGGTGRQRDWVDGAIGACTYDLTLIDATVTVQWVDPLPQSPDIGHAHSYMVTTSNGVREFTISIATWADDASNPNNSGLPNPSQDIQTFYEQSFVHELGHVVHFSTITSDDERTHAASLFWTPDTSGGSGRRFGTLADWSATTWAQNMMEAIAETFKCVYYQGDLIYRNRTIWHLDAKNWPELWTMLIPPYKYLWKAPAANFDGQGHTFNLDSIGKFDVTYLQHADAQFGYGPVRQPPGTPMPNGGGTYDLSLAIISYDPANPSNPIAVAAIGVSGAIDDEPFGHAPPVNWAVTTMSIGGVNLIANESVSNQGGLLQITVDPVGDIPGHVTVTLLGPDGITVTGDTQISTNHVLGMELTGDSQGYADPQAGGAGFVSQGAAFPPPYPFGDSSGSMEVGSGLRGAILIGSN